MAKQRNKNQKTVEETTEVEQVETQSTEVNGAPTPDGPTAEEIAAVEAQEAEEAAKAEAAEKEEAERLAKEQADKEAAEAEAKKEEERLAEEKRLQEEKAKKAKGKNPLTDSKVSIADKVKYCLTEATGKVRVTANILESYNKVMKPGAVQNEQLMVGKQYELLNLYRTIFSIEDFGAFKQQFDIVNLFFNHYAKESMGGHYLSRFDYLWKWDQEELTTLLNVNEVISQLANYETRQQRIKQLNLEYALNPDETIVSDIARDNVIRYYSA